MKEPTEILATRIAAAFANIGIECIPAIEEYFEESDIPREVSYGCRARFWIDKDGNMRAQVIPQPPKLPTVELEKTDFVLNRRDGQLHFDYVGQPKENKPDDPATVVPAPPGAVATPPHPPMTDPVPREAAIAASQVPSPNKSANGAQPPDPALPPIPENTRARCAAVMETGDHQYVPIDDQPGFYMCRCGQRGIFNQGAEVPQ